jgi:hypothetical protein
LARLSVVITSGSLAILGGALILFSGVKVQSFMLDAVQYVYAKESNVLPQSLEPVVRGFVFVVSVIIIFGGLLAIVGGIVVFTRHLTIGKVLIALGGGIGFAGLIFAVGYDVYAYGFSILSSRLYYWIGVVLATIARYILKYS